MPTPIACPCVFCNCAAQDRISFQRQTPATSVGQADATVYQYPICENCYKLVMPFVLFPMQFALHEGLFDSLSKLKKVEV